MNRPLLLTTIALTLGSSACSGNHFTPVTPEGVPARHGRASSAQYKLLYAFKGAPDGASPLAGLVAFNGKLYGTTLNGSKPYCNLGCGTVFSVTTTGKERIVYSFKGNENNAHDGLWPFASM